MNARRDGAGKGNRRKRVKELEKGEIIGKRERIGEIVGYSRWELPDKPN